MTVDDILASIVLTPFSDADMAALHDAFLRKDAALLHSLLRSHLTLTTTPPTAQPARAWPPHWEIK